MKRNMLCSVVCATPFACLQPVAIAFAQAPGGGAGVQTPTTPSTFPSPNSPGQMA